MPTRPSKERPEFLPIGPTTRLRAYVRRSYDGEDELTYSMDAQRRHVNDWVANLGAPPVEQFYNDAGGKSRADTLARPVLMQAMNDARRGEYDKLIVWKYDRFSRDQNLGSQALFQFEAVYGVEVISTLEPVPDGPMATMMRQLYLFVAQTEWNSIVARFQGGRAERVRSGSLPGVPVSLFGLKHTDRGNGKGRGDNNAFYVADNDSIDSNPDHAPARVVIQIYEMALAGGTTRSISKALTEQGIPTAGMVYSARGTWPRGKSYSSDWRPSVIGRILSQPAYRGVFEAWRWAYVTEQQRNPLSGEMEEVTHQIRRPVDDENIFRLEGAILDKLIDDETWFAVQEHMDRNKRDAYRNAAHPEGALLRYGFAHCGYCGSNILAKYTKSRNVHHYRCAMGDHAVSSDQAKCKDKGGGRFSWVSESVDEMVWQWVIKQFEHPELIRAKYEEWRQDQDSGRVLEVDRHTSLEELLAAATEKRNNNMDLAAITNDPGMRAEYNHRAEQLSGQMKGYASDLAKIEAAFVGNDKMERHVENIIAMGQQALDYLRQADYASKRAVLYAFDVQVKLWRHTRTTAQGEPDAIAISWVLDGAERVWHRLGVPAVLQSPLLLTPTIGY